MVTVIMRDLLYTEIPTTFYRVTHQDCSNLQLIWFRQSLRLMAATVATYCPGRMAEHPKPKSTGGFYHPDGSPCTHNPAHRLSWICWNDNTPHVQIQYNGLLNKIL